MNQRVFSSTLVSSRAPVASVFTEAARSPGHRRQSLYLNGVTNNEASKLPNRLENWLLV